MRPVSKCLTGPFNLLGWYSRDHVRSCGGKSNQTVGPFVENNRLTMGEVDVHYQSFCGAFVIHTAHYHANVYRRHDIHGRGWHAI